MPRTRIDIDARIDYLSVLDEKGTTDSDLEPDIPDNLLLSLHESMVLGGRFDERMLSLQRQGRIGTFPPISGQEAAHLGAVANLQPSDWFIPAFRETAAELCRGRTLEEILLYYGGYNEGGRVADGRNDLERDPYNRGDAGDLFGKTDGIALAYHTNPSSRRWDRSDSELVIANIGRRGKSIAFEIQ